MASNIANFTIYVSALAFLLSVRKLGLVAKLGLSQYAYKNMEGPSAETSTISHRFLMSPLGAKLNKII